MASAIHKGAVEFQGSVAVPAGSIARTSAPVGLITSTASSAVAILSTTTEISLAATTGTVVISTTSSFAGQMVFLRMTTLSGGSYTLAVTGGTLTLNSAGEAAMVIRNAANTAWLVVALTASSSTGANIATIV